MFLAVRDPLMDSSIPSITSYMPEKAVRGLALAFPHTVIGGQVVDQVGRKPAIAIDQKAFINCPGEPAAEPMKMGLRFSRGSPKPEPDVILGILRVAQPASFHQVMSGGATNRVEGSSVPHGDKKFGENKTLRRLHQVFSKRPPPEIIDFFDFLSGHSKNGMLDRSQFQDSALEIKLVRFSSSIRLSRSMQAEKPAGVRT
jgi:hypothetical protein